MWLLFFSDSERTVVDQTDVYLEKLQGLLAILDELQKQLENDDVVALKTRANNLLRLVKKEGNLNAGGKFEWVDSVLVKVI